jgi:sulfur carrier protein
MSEDKTVSVNGEEERVAAGTVAELLQSRGVPTDGRGVAVAVNGTLVPRARWPSARLEPGDRIEIIKPVVGG